jgi:hypothetical protein
MTEFLNKVVSDTEPWKMIPDSEENILRDLENYTLDPVFEMYGNFIDPDPEWLDDEVAAKYAGCTSIFGNFLDYSHAFRMVTDDEALIARITASVVKNKRRPEYQTALEKMVDRLPTLTMENAKVGNYYAMGGIWMRLTNVYRITEDQANENALLYRNRFEGITRDGETISAALPGSDTVATTQNWKI